MGLVYPPGTVIPFDIPPHSKILTGNRIKDDATDLIVAALSTSFFPQAKQQYLATINKAISIYRYTYHPVKTVAPKLNRQQRRASKRKVTYGRR